MTLQRRLAAIEAAIPDPLPCRVCKDWPRILIRRPHLAGSDLSGWPVEPICPVCGRQPKLYVAIERIGAAPQAATPAS